MVASHFSAVVSCAGGTSRYFGVALMRCPDKPGLAAHGEPRSGQRRIGDGPARSGLVAMVGVEQRVAVLHGRPVAAARLEKIDEHLGLRLGRGLTHAAGEIGEGAKVIIDEHLAGDADLAGEGLDLVRLLGLGHGAGLDLAVLVQLLQHRRLAEHDLVHRAEVPRGGLAAEAADADGRGLIGGAQRAADRVADDEREVARGVQRAGDDRRRRQAGDGWPRKVSSSRAISAQVA